MHIVRRNASIPSLQTVFYAAFPVGVSVSSSWYSFCQHNNVWLFNYLSSQYLKSPALKWHACANRCLGDIWFLSALEFLTQEVRWLTCTPKKCSDNPDVFKTNNLVSTSQWRPPDNIQDIHLVKSSRSSLWRHQAPDDFCLSVTKALLWFWKQAYQDWVFDSTLSDSYVMTKSNLISIKNGYDDRYTECKNVILDIIWKSRNNFSLGIQELVDEFSCH